MADVDLNEPGNALESALDALQADKAAQGQPFGGRGYWDWFSMEELRERPDMSQDVTALLPAVAEAADRCPARATGYVPKPIDTSKIQLSPTILQLTEQLAENTHEVWAAQRMADGWTHGPERDDAKKKHPCLVPYRELPDSEKEYDRKTAMETLKAITALGYNVRPAKEPG
jgi:ryanodine receptor 2